MVFDFEIEGKKYSLFFGMVATEIMARKSVNLVGLDDKSEEARLKTFSYLVYGGLCNQADRKDISRPPYEEAYDLAMAIIGHSDELQTNIWNTWAETRPAKVMLDKLPKPTTEDGKKKEEAENQ